MHIIYLGAAARGRENNLNLIRASAATAVLVSHAWPISLGSGVDEPLAALTGHSLGTLAVYAFFVISGFLITQLLLKRIEETGTISLADFYSKRARRLLPCLALVLFTSSVMGALLLPPFGEKQELGLSGWAAICAVMCCRICA